MESTRLENAVLTQARRDLDYWSAGDSEGYGLSAADDVTYFNNGAPHARVDGIEAFRALLAAWKGQIPPHRYELVDPKVQVYGGVGILTLQYHAFTPEGEPLVRGRGTLVYHRTDDGWKMVHTHWSSSEDA